MKMLIVDDSKPIRKIMARMLGQMGHETFEAGDGKEAISTMESHPDISLVMLDWNMPKMDGLETLKALNARDRSFPKPMVVMVTTENEMGKIVEAMSQGANEYIMKPFTKEILEEKLAILGIKGVSHV